MVPKTRTLTIGLTTTLMKANKRLTQLVLFSQARRQLPTNLATPTTGTNKRKCLLYGTRSPACLTLLIPRHPWGEKKSLCSVISYIPMTNRKFLKGQKKKIRSWYRNVKFGEMDPIGLANTKVMKLRLFHLGKGVVRPKFS